MHFRSLLPASADASEKVRTIIENHVLERNKVYYPIVPKKSAEVSGDAKSTGNGDDNGTPATPHPGSPNRTDPTPGGDGSKNGLRSKAYGIDIQRQSFDPSHTTPEGSYATEFYSEHTTKPSGYHSISYYYPRTTAAGLQRTKNYSLLNRKYNISRADDGKDIENRGYQDLNKVN